MTLNGVTTSRIIGPGIPSFVFLIIAAVLTQICMTLKVVVYLSERRDSSEEGDNLGYGSKYEPNLDTTVLKTLQSGLIKWCKDAKNSHRGAAT